MKAITIYADGGSRGNPGPAASGAVLLDASGNLIREVGRNLGIATNNVAEWTALVIALEAAGELGATTLRIRMDSELVVKQVLGTYRVRHPALIPLHAHVRRLLASFEQYDIAHVPRAENAAADAVVNRLLDARRRDHAAP